VLREEILDWQDDSAWGSCDQNLSSLLPHLLPAFTKSSLSPHEERFGLAALFPLSYWQKLCQQCHTATLHGMGCQK